MQADWITSITSRFGDDLNLHHVATREAQIAELPEWLSEDTKVALSSQGITSLWQHQREAIELFQQGSNIAISTGTASGKSLCYQIPILHAIDSGPKAKALYLAPTKALAHDQERSLIDFKHPKVHTATYDGDADHLQKKYARDHANVVIANPDMIHHGMLATHDAWAHFLRNLEVIAVDECHLYRGMFGAHVSNVLKRLLRICDLYGSHPKVIMTSATVAQPAEHAHMLSGLAFTEITQDTSPHGPLTVGMTLPRITLGTDVEGNALRRSAVAEAADALTDLVVSGIRSIVFVRSRKAAETVATITREKLSEVSDSLISKVTSYRAGYLPEERRAIEKLLRDGDLLGVASTSALELGVDISGLDAVVMTGWPGTRASFWQQAGRAGRENQEALALMIATDNPLDHYLVKHPETVFGRTVEAAVCDPTNENILYGHLAVAAAEQHIKETEVELFGPKEKVLGLLESLTNNGTLKRRPQGWFWAGEGRAQKLVDIRGSGVPPFQIVETGTGRLLGSVDASSAFMQVHEGAIYVHLGETYLVDELNHIDSVAFVSATNVEYTTYARDITTVDLVEAHESKRWGQFDISFGLVDVTEQVISYQKRRLITGQVLGEEVLNLPPQTLRTEAVWWTAPLSVFNSLEIHDIAGTAHAAEHAAIGLLPLFTLCDRWDIGGVSVAEHPDNGMCTVVIYDGHAGGAGFAKHGYSVAHEWLTATRDAIRDCECSEGCPGCIQSPKCGNNNHPLDKAGAIKFLTALLDQL